MLEDKINIENKINMGNCLCIIVDDTACFVTNYDRPISVELLHGNSEITYDSGNIYKSGGVEKVIFHLDWRYGTSDPPGRIISHPLSQDIIEKSKELIKLLKEN